MQQHHGIPVQEPIARLVGEWEWEEYPWIPADQVDRADESILIMPDGYDFE